MGVIYTTTLLGKRQGFAARKDFIPTVQQQGCVLRAPEAQEAQHTWPGVGQPNARARAPVPRAALAPYCSSTGAARCELESSVSATDTMEHFIADFQVLSRMGRMMGHLLITARFPSGSDRDATEEMIFLPDVSVFQSEFTCDSCPPGLR